MSRWKVLLLLAAAAYPAPAHAAAANEATARCTFAGVTTLAGQFEFVFGGTIVATATGTTQASSTTITCRLVSGTVSSATTRTCSTPACATVGRAGPWPIRPVVICASGEAVYGNPPSATVTLEEECRSTVV